MFFFSFRDMWFLQVDVVRPLPNPQTGEPDLRIYDPRRLIGPYLPSGIGWLWNSGVSLPTLKIILSPSGAFMELKIHRVTWYKFSSYCSKFICASTEYERQWNMLNLKSNDLYTRLHSTGAVIPVRYMTDSKHKNPTMLFTANFNQNSSHTFGKI